MPVIGKASDGSRHYFKRFYLFTREEMRVGLRGKVEYVEDLETGKRYVDVDSYNKHVENLNTEFAQMMGRSANIEVKLGELMQNHDRLEADFKALGVLHSQIVEQKCKLEGQLEVAGCRLDEQRDIYNEQLVQLRKWFQEELTRKEAEAAALREAINGLRVAITQQGDMIGDSHKEAIEGLTKQLELLDKDFVDVAKAMRVYRQDKDRPVKGYRIKID